MMNSLSKIFVFVVITLLGIGHIQLVIARDCGQNEVYVNCEMQISCQPSCDQPNGTLCPLIPCSQGCYCKEGYIRASRTNTTCIRKSQCSAMHGNQSICGPNEKKVICAPLQSCQPSCNTPNGTVCPRVCDVKPCVCKEGFIRDNNNNLQCIERTQCNKNVTSNSSRCGPNEVAIDCAPLQTCQPSCEQPNGTVCPLICSINPCICKEGFIRDQNNNLTCIEKTQCQENSTRKSVICRENEEYNKCANPCQPSCVQPNRKPCETLRCSEGCVCRKGYLRATNEITSSCIKCTN